jgi:hypothetical protein
MEWSPLALLGQIVEGTPATVTPHMAGPMILPELLQRKSLFSFLYKIDLDLAEQTQAKGCPFVGDRCIARIISESLEVVLLILMRHLRFVLAYAVAVQAAVDGYCRLQ